MTRWRGLVKKEWVLGWKGMLLLVAVCSAITLFSVSYAFNGVPDDFATEVSSLIGTMVLIHVGGGVALFVGGLKQEMDRADSWLHSPAPVMELFAAKAAITVLTLLTSLLACAMVVGGIYYAGGGTIPIARGILLVFSVVVAILQNSIIAMATGSFIWVIFHVFNSRVGKVSYIITFALFVMGAYGWLLFMFTDVYSAINEMGPIFGFLSTTYPDFNYKNYIMMGLAPESAFLTIGNLLFYVVLSAALFISGSMLFEKKVRL